MTSPRVLPIDGVSKQETTFSEQPILLLSPDDLGPGEETIKHDQPSTIVSDARPDPKPRKHPQLWQAYLWWYTLVELRKKYTLRLSSIERGKSSMDAIIEKDMAQQLGMVYLVEGGASVAQLERAAQRGTAIDLLIADTKKNMVTWGTMVPVWDWATSIKGMGEGGLAAQLLAQIDDISKFDTVASLWRFAGYAVIEGKAEKNQKGEKSHFNHKLKGVCFNIADQFIKQQTPGYVDIYYAEKARQRELNPDVLCKQCSNGTLVKWEDCQHKKSHTKLMNDAHLHNRAWRKMIKAFLRDLWVEWKSCEE